MSSACARNGASAWTIDLVRAAEFVEVVHVKRAEISLQRVEDIGDGNAELLRARAVDVGVELRDVDVEAGEKSRKD